MIGETQAIIRGKWGDSTGNSLDFFLSLLPPYPPSLIELESAINQHREYHVTGTGETGLATEYQSG